MLLPIALVLVGDLLTGRGVAPALGARQNTIWRHQNLLAGADLTLGNLEAAPHTSQTKAKPFYNSGDFQTLRAAGFDGFSLANNHALDAGAAGARQTQIGLGQLALKGAGLALDGSDPVPIWTVGGRRIAVVAATQWGPFENGGARLTRLDVAALTRQIADLSASNVFVIASLHWGTEGVTTISAAQRQTAHALIDAGAIAVWGHHPHVAGPVESYRGRPIFASTGNFLWDSMKTPQNGLLARLVVEGQTPQTAKVSWKSWRVDPRAQLLTAPPTPPGETRVGAWAGRFAGETASVGWLLWTRNAAQNPLLRVLDKTPSGWRVRAAGFPREVRRVEIGDLNGDGRDEAVIELRQRSKLDPQIKPRLHIYDVGASGFRPLWRGSMLSRPFTAWQLVGRADDVSCDLAALERGLNGTGWLTVYRWNGFGLRAVWQQQFTGELRALQSGCDQNGVFLRFGSNGKNWLARRSGGQSWRVVAGTYPQQATQRPGESARQKQIR